VTTVGGTYHGYAINTAAASWFVGAQVYFLTTTTTPALRGKAYDITIFANASPTATFTAPTLDDTPVSGDLCYIFWPIPASNVSITFGTENLERDLVRQSLDRPSALKGLKTCSGSFDVEIPGLVTPSVPAAAGAPGIDRFSALLEAVGTRRAPASTEVTTGTLGASTFSVTSAASLAIDDYVLLNNEVRRITAVDTTLTPDEITVAPALSAAPIHGDDLYTGEQFKPADYDLMSLSILHLKDDRLCEIRGAVCSFKIGAEFGAMLLGSVEFDAAYLNSTTQVQEGWDISQPFTELDGSQPSKKPPVFKASAASLFAGTSLAIASFEFDLGHDRGDHRYVDNHYFTVIARAAVCSVNWKDESVVPKETWEAIGTTGDLIIACGKAAGDCVVVCGNAQVYDPLSNAENNSFQDYNGSFSFCDDQTDATLARKPQVVRF